MNNEATQLEDEAIARTTFFQSIVALEFGHHTMNFIAATQQYLQISEARVKERLCVSERQSPYHFWLACWCPWELIFSHLSIKVVRYDLRHTVISPFLPPSIPITNMPFKFSQRFSGSAVSYPVVPQPKSNLVHLCHKLWHPVLTVLTILLRINWSNFALFNFKQQRQKLFRVTPKGTGRPLKIRHWMCPILCHTEIVTKCQTPSKRRTDGRTDKHTHGNNVTSCWLVESQRRRHAVSTSLRLVTNRRTDRRRGVCPSVRPSVS